MKAKVELSISFEVDVDEVNKRVENELREKLKGVKLVDKSNIIKNIDDTYVDRINFTDDDGVEYQWTINNKHEEEYFKPACKYGYTDCVCDPMYIKTTHPEWWKDLGCPTTCDDCDDGDGYDDEDK